MFIMSHILSIPFAQSKILRSPPSPADNEFIGNESADFKIDRRRATSAKTLSASANETNCEFKESVSIENSE
jgi:hypothetical protein